MGNNRATVLARTIAGCLCGLGLLTTALAPSAGAAAPEAVCFVYADSLAVTIDGQSPLDPARTGRLADGYPLTCELRVSLFRRVPVWFDEHEIEVRMRWRLLRRTIDGRLHLALNDFQGKDAELICDDLGDIHDLMDAHLLALLMPVDDLDHAARYYVVTELLCQALSFDDVVKAERWLKQGSTAETDPSGDRSPTAGEVALRYLWDVAGLRPEKERGQTDSFRLQELRRLD